MEIDRRSVAEQALASGRSPARTTFGWQCPTLNGDNPRNNRGSGRPSCRTSSPEPPALHQHQRPLVIVEERGKARWRLRISATSSSGPRKGRSPRHGRPFQSIVQVGAISGPREHALAKFISMPRESSGCERKRRAPSRTIIAPATRPRSAAAYSASLDHIDRRRNHPRRPPASGGALRSPPGWRFEIVEAERSRQRLGPCFRGSGSPFPPAIRRSDLPEQRGRLLLGG